jgi:hypothetical protein
MKAESRTQGLTPRSRSLTAVEVCSRNRQGINKELDELREEVGGQIEVIISSSDQVFGKVISRKSSVSH